MARSLCLLVITVTIMACSVTEDPAWTPRERALARRIRTARTLSAWVTGTDTIDLQIPDSVRVDIVPRVVVTRNGFAICNPIGRSIVSVSRDGRFLGRIGRTGSGPGEFRSIIAATADSLGNLYVFDNLLARISCFSPAGMLFGTIPVRRPFVVRHLCAVSSGAIYLHHAPDSGGGGFVTLTEAGAREQQLLPSEQHYEAYYYRGHLEGGLLSGRDGTVFETNAYSPTIRRIRGTIAAKSFGEEVAEFTPLPPSRSFVTIHQLQDAVLEASVVRGLFLVGNGELLLQELIRFTGPARSIDRRLIVYDTAGVWLGSLRGDAGVIETSDGDALIQVINSFSPPGGTAELQHPRLPRIVVLHIGGFDHE